MCTRGRGRQLKDLSRQMHDEVREGGNSVLCGLWGPPDMMSASEGEGGSWKADVVREVA